MRIRVLIASLSLFGSVLLTVTASAEKLLRWKFQPGQSLEVVLDQDVEMATNLTGNEMRSSADMGMTLAWNVREVDADGAAQMEQSIDRIRMKVNMPGSVPIDFDSAATVPSDGMSKHLAESVHPLIGTSFSQQVTERGELVDMKLTKAAAASLEATAPGTQINDSFSHDGLASLIRQAALVLPQHPVSPGETWESATRIDSPAGSLQMHTTYTYQGTEQKHGRSLERINLEITMGFAAGPNAMGLDVKISDQKNSGTIYFDAELGRFVSSDIQQNLTMETRLGEQVHRQQLNTKIRMTVSDTTQVASRDATLQR